MKHAMPRLVLNTPFISHDAIMGGGTLFLELGECPNRNWGVQ